MKLTIRPLTPERWPDIETLFAAKGCSIPRSCWCMCYRRSGTLPLPANKTRAQVNRADFRKLVKSGEPPGLIGYRGKTPVGWVSLGPREAFAKLARSPVMKPVDDARVWSIVCFVVPPEYRGHGVARAMLDGAIAYAKSRGVRLLEAYPVDKVGRVKGDWLWFGPKSMYDDAGFEEVARRKPERPIVRIRPV
jgi:GNAT superfamily N-acetyltransferase